MESCGPCGSLGVEVDDHQSLHEQQPNQQAHESGAGQRKGREWTTIR